MDKEIFCDGFSKRNLAHTMYRAANTALLIRVVKLLTFFVIFNFVKKIC